MQEQGRDRSHAVPTPAEVERIDSRHQWGLNLMVIAGQFGVFAVLLTLWSGQDLTYSPGWLHPMAYYNALCVVVCLALGAWGAYLRRDYSSL